MYQLANGYTKESVMEKIRKYNNGKRAQDPGRGCLYETADGNRCLIGCFIPGEEIKTAVASGEFVVTLLDELPQLVKFMPFENKGVLHEFQKLHDDCIGGDDIRELAKKWLDENVA